MLIFTIESLSLAIDTTYFPMIVAFFAGIAIYHALVALTTIAPSLYNRCLVLHFSREPRDGDDAVKSYKLVRWARALTDPLWSHYGFFGIEGRYYEPLLLSRDAVESLLQVLQAYNIARFTSQPWLVRMCVLLVVVNCMATLILQQLLARRKNRVPLQRLLYLICDIILNFSSTAVFGTLLTISYIKAYDPRLTQIPQRHFSDTPWFPLMVNEFRLVLITSWLDLLSKVTFSLSILGTTNDAKLLLHSLPRGFSQPMTLRLRLQQIPTTRHRP